MNLHFDVLFVLSRSRPPSALPLVAREYGNVSLTSVDFLSVANANYSTRNLVAAVNVVVFLNSGLLALALHAFFCVISVAAAQYKKLTAVESRDCQASISSRWWRVCSLLACKGDNWSLRKISQCTN